MRVLVTQSYPTLVTSWTVAHQAPLSTGFSRQEHWSGWPFPSPGDLPDPGITPGSPALQADSLLSEPPGKPKSAGFYLKKRDFSSVSGAKAPSSQSRGGADSIPRRGTRSHKLQLKIPQATTKTEDPSSLNYDPVQPKRMNTKECEKVNLLNFPK